MSVQINKNGHVTITCKGFTSADDHVARIKAVIELVQQRSTDFADSTAVYYALDLVMDMLPDEEHWKKLMPGE